MFRIIDNAPPRGTVMETNHDYFTVLPDGGESQPLPTWKTYCKYTCTLYCIFIFWCSYRCLMVKIRIPKCTCTVYLLIYQTLHIKDQNTIFTEKYSKLSSYRSIIVTVYCFLLTYGMMTHKCFKILIIFCNMTHDFH